MSKKVICPSCGNTNWTGSSFCNKCSANLKIHNKETNFNLKFLTSYKSLP